LAKKGMDRLSHPVPMAGCCQPNFQSRESEMLSALGRGPDVKTRWGRLQQSSGGWWSAKPGEEGKGVQHEGASRNQRRLDEPEHEAADAGRRWNAIVG
jgi:hypothetical protein